MRFLLGLVALLAFVLPSFAQTETKEASSDIPALIRKLGSPRFQERQKAIFELEKLGQPAMKYLKKAITSDNLEIRTAAGSILAKLEQESFTDNLLAPTMVQMGKTMTVWAAIQELSKQSGYPIQVNSNLKTELEKRKITFDGNKTSFWQAFDHLCREGGLEQVVSTTPNRNNRFNTRTINLPRNNLPIQIRQQQLKKIKELQEKVKKLQQEQLKKLQQKQIPNILPPNQIIPNIQPKNIQRNIKGIKIQGGKIRLQKAFPAVPKAIAPKQAVPVPQKPFKINRNPIPNNANAAFQQVAVALAQVQVPAQVPAPPQAPPPVRGRIVVNGIDYSTVNPSTNNTGIGVKIGESQKLPTCYIGAVRVQVLSVNKKNSTDLDITFRVTAEPRLKNLTLYGSPVIEKAIDNLGQKLRKDMGMDETPKVANNPFNRPVFVRTYRNYNQKPVTQSTVTLKLGKKSADSLTELKGTLVAKVSTPAEELVRIKDVMRNTGKAFKTKNGDALEIVSLQKIGSYYQLQVKSGNPGNGIFRGNGGGAIIINGGGRVVINGMQIGGNNGNSNGNSTMPVLVDKNGKELQRVGSPSTSFRSINGKAEIVNTIRYRANGTTGEPAELILTGQRQVSVDLPFRFENITLPK